MVANKGIVPIGLITTKRAMVDLKRSFPKMFKNENKSCNIYGNYILSHGIYKSKAAAFIHNTGTSNMVCKFHNVTSTTTATATTTMKIKTLTYITNTIHFIELDKGKTILQGALLT